MGSSATRTWTPRGPAVGSEDANVANMKKRPSWACTSGAQNWVSAQNPAGGRNAGIGPCHVSRSSLVKQSKPVAGPPHMFVSVVPNSTKPPEANSRTNGSRIRISLNRTSITLGEPFRRWNAQATMPAISGALR